MLSDVARAFRNAWQQITGKREKQTMTWAEFSEGWASLPTREKVVWTAMYVAAITVFCWLLLTLLGVGPW